MKLPSPSALLIKLFSDLLLASRRSSPEGKVLLGSLVVLSVLVTSSYFPAIEIPSINLAAATPATSNLPLFGNPTSEDFMSYAVAIMPTVPGANLNISNVAGSTNCDLLVPVTYIDAGCMNSLPLLFPFNEPQQTNITEPINQTFYDNYGNTSALDLSIGVASDNITAGDTQTVTVTVSDQNSTQPIPGALVLANVTDSFNSLLHEYSGTTDEVGQVSFPFVIPADAASDIYTVSVLASAGGYENNSASTTFDVIGSGDFFDNSTSDNFSDGSSSSDNCCSSSDSSSSNDDFTSPTVKSTDPSDGDNNVPSDLSEIKVTFSESIDKDTIDSGSLSVFADNCGNDFCNDPDIQDVSVSSKTATFSINSNDRLSPNTNYIASISSSIQDQDGNFLDCFDSKGVDDNCEWNFSTSGSTSNPTISSNPTSGPVGSSVTVTGNGFDPISSVDITFGGSNVATVTPTSNGGFTTTFRVPLSSSIGDQTVKATQGSNSASKTFTVTALVNPIIFLDPDSGPVGSSVDIAGAGFDPSSTITIEFGGSTVAEETSTPNGGFAATFSVPLSSSIGDQTVKATQGSNSATQTFTVISSTAPAIFLNPNSGPVDTLVTVTGINFDPTTPVTIKFGDTTVTPTPNPVTPNSNGGFSATFMVPTSSSGPKSVTATQGSKSPSQTFTVTSSTAPAITLNPTSGAVDTQVTVTGTNFDPSSVVTIYYDGNLVTTNPPTVTPTNNGGFSATFAVPDPSSNGPHQVVATQGDSSASKPFTVTPPATPTITLDPISGSVGTQVTVTGINFDPSSIVTIYFDGNLMTTSPPTVTPTSSGGISATFTVPASLNGPQTVVANQGDNSPSATFTVEPVTMTTLSHPTTSSLSINETKDHNSNDNNARPNTSSSDLIETTQNSQNVNRKSLSDVNVKDKDISSKDSESQSTQNSVTEKPTTVTDDKTTTIVKSSDSDNQPDKQSRSSDSVKKDRALFFKYLNSNKDNVDEQHKTEVNNRPVAINDEATTESNNPVKINILSNDKDPDGDKLSVMGVSRPVRGTIESDADGTITYSPLKSWSGTERFGYTISDGRGGVATGTVTVIVQNQPPEAEDQDISVNANNPLKIKLEAKDPDDNKLKFVLDTKPSHGRIVQFSSSTGTLGYVPDENYDGKDDFAFKVHDGNVFSKDAKVSIKIEKNEKLSNDEVQQDRQHPKKQQESNQAPTNDKKANDEKSNNDIPPSDSSQQSSTSSQDAEQPKTDQKQEEQQSSEPDKSTSNADTASSGESQPNS